MEMWQAIKEYYPKDEFKTIRAFIPHKFDSIAMECLEGAVDVDEPKFNIAEYVNQGTKIIFGRSGVMSYKSQGIKKILNRYDSAIFINSLRASVNDVFNEKYKGYGFMMYDDLNCSDNYPLLMTTIDSLHKQRGIKQLVVLDEIESILRHMVSFPKHKAIIWDTLCSLIRNAECVLVLDATLSNETIGIIREIDPDASFVIVNNKFQTMKGRKANMCVCNSRTREIMKTMEILKAGHKICVPSNSKSYVKSLNNMCKDEGLNTLAIYEGMPFVPTSEWHNYDGVFYSPSISQGLSFDVPEHFKEIRAFVTNKSTIAESVFQALHRARNTIDNYVYIAYEHTEFSEEDETIEGFMELVDKQVSLHESGLSYNRVTEKLEENTYLKAVAKEYIERSKSKNRLVCILRGIMENHGYETSLTFDIDEQTKTEDTIQKQIVEINAIHTENEAQLVVDAQCITMNTFDNMRMQTHLNTEEQAEMTKRRIMNDYWDSRVETPPTLDAKFVVKVLKPGVMQARRNYNLFKKMKNIDDTIENMITNKYTQMIEHNETSIAHILDMSNYGYKARHFEGLVKACGWENHNDDKKIIPNYVDISSYIAKNQVELERVWPDSKITSIDPKYISKYVNSKFMEMGFTMTNSTKNKNDKHKLLKQRLYDFLEPYNIQD